MMTKKRLQSSPILDFFEFKWKYYVNKLLSVIKITSTTDKFLFVSHAGTSDWILGAKARRLSKHFKAGSEVLFSEKFKNLPIAPGYFFLHQKYYAKALRYNPHLKRAKCIVMFTHPEWNKFYSKSHAFYTLKNASSIICLNHNMAHELMELGIPKDRISVFHLASNPEFFQPKDNRKGQTVGFCCYYSNRKNPELIYDLVMKMSDINFILVGQNWENYPKFDQLMRAPNFTYYGDKSYEEYPGLYRLMDVFVSPSYLEGGPVPLLEAMLSNVVPVASNTGFCPDLIKHGVNGFLFDPHTNTTEEVIDFVQKALVLEGDVRKDVVAHSWKEYGRKIYALYRLA
ncbi:MAG: glycosyltransferase family 4 protein [Marinilabiliaceae bacterium]|nr:glycosyltransferase family 4 protein [Marinilabiliaceae bacterium]